MEGHASSHKVQAPHFIANGGMGAFLRLLSLPKLDTVSSFILELYYNWGSRLVVYFNILDLNSRD